MALAKRIQELQITASATTSWASNNHKTLQQKREASKQKTHEYYCYIWIQRLQRQERSKQTQLQV
jgi:hypothetical protein